MSEAPECGAGLTSETRALKPTGPSAGQASFYSRVPLPVTSGATASGALTKAWSRHEMAGEGPAHRWQVRGQLGQVLAQSWVHDVPWVPARTCGALVGGGRENEQVSKSLYKVCVGSVSY